MRFSRPFVLLLVMMLYAGPALASSADQPAFGLIGSLSAKPGQRDALIAAIAGGAADMPGCYSYVIAADNANPDQIWITEVWDTKASHDRSLNLPSVRAAIAKARPLIAGMGSQIVTTPEAGLGPNRPKTP